MVKVKIFGNGAVQVGDKLYHYYDGEEVEMPLEGVKSTGREHKIIEEYKVHKAVVKKSQVVNKYPIHEGAGWYVLSNGEKVRGKENALKQEKEIES